MQVYRELMELDFFAPVALTRALVPAMRERRSGHVVMISSIAGKIGAPQRTGYSAAKHALAGFSEAARAELWRDGLQFTVVYPGYVKTQIAHNALKGDGSANGAIDDNIAHGLPVEDCAADIWDAVEQNEEEVVMGGVEVNYLRLKRFAPKLFAFALKRARR
jgi:short-subunit dehydrogenase